jgi:predicted transcriptional regulator
MTDPLDDASPSISTLDFLASSRHRIEILRSLRESGPSTRRDLRESVDASRSTVRRTLEGFLERDWVASVDGGYRLTVAGGMVAEEFAQLAETVRITREYAPLLRHLPDSALDVEPTWLEGSSLTTATDAEPYAPAQRQTETASQAERFRLVLPSIELEGAKLGHRRVLDGELHGEMVLSRGTAETVRSDPFADLFAEQIATGRMDVYAHPGEPPMYLGLLDDDRVEIGCENEQGIPRALLESTDDRLRSWAESAFEEYVAEAEPLTESAF